MNASDDSSKLDIWWRHLVAGGAAGAVSRTCTAPLDRLRVFHQVHGTKTNGIWSCLHYLFKDGGFSGFWRGNGINVVKIAPESAIKFVAYDQIKCTMRGNDSREMSICKRFVAGSLAGAISQTAIYPLDVLKTILALGTTDQYKSIAEIVMTIHKEEGLKTFYRGYIPSLLGIIPFTGINLAVYETLKNYYIQKHNDTPGALFLLACGAVSSTCGQIVSYPMDLVRTRLQAQAVSTKNGGPHDEPCTMTCLLRNTVQREGFLGLYRGIIPCFFKMVPTVSISYLVYERFSRTLGIKMT